MLLAYPNLIAKWAVQIERRGQFVYNLIDHKATIQFIAWGIQNLWIENIPRPI